MPDFYVRGLDHAGFEALFDPTGADEHLAGALDALSINAAAGDDASIELLLNLALRPDRTGTDAENILFGLFSGTPVPGICHVAPGVDNDIASRSLRLFESRHLTAPGALFGNDGEADKLASPSKLLYMAGAATKAGDAIHADITGALVGASAGGNANVHMDTAFPALPEGCSLKRDNPWSRNRLVAANEIGAAIQAIAASADSAGYTDITSLEALATDSGTASLREAVDTRFFEGKSIVFVPLNTGNHWTSLIIYKETPDDRRKAVVFDSISGGASRHSAAIAARLAVAEEDITCAEADLQGGAPNACGIYTVEAFRHVAGAPAGVDPGDALNDLIARYNTPEAQNRLNVVGRRQIHGMLIDNVRNDMSA